MPNAKCLMNGERQTNAYRLPGRELLYAPPVVRAVNEEMQSRTLSTDSLTRLVCGFASRASLREEESGKERTAKFAQGKAHARSQAVKRSALPFTRVFRQAN